MKIRVIVCTIVAILAASIIGDSAGASSFSFTFDTDPQIGVSGQPGTLAHLSGIATPDELVGLDCDVTLTLVNDSTRGGTGFVVSSGGVNLERGDVEAAKGTFTWPLGHLVLGPYVNAWVRFGPKGEASVDGSVELSCPDVPPTTVPPTTTTTPQPPAGRFAAPTPVPATPQFTG